MMKSRLLGAVGIVAIVGSVVVGLSAQTPAKPLAFEVASVKPDTAGPAGGNSVMNTPGRLTLINATLRGVVTFAYGIQDFQLLNEPKWIGDERFDINATMPIGTTSDQRLLMLQHLLAERFKLAVHTESRDVSSYVLTLAHADGRLRPRLRRPVVDCDALREAARQNPGTSPWPPPQSGDRPACAIKMGPGMVSAGGVPLSILTTTLSRQSGRPVVDRTGLTGNFDIQLEFDLGSLVPLRNPGGPNGRALDTSDRPSIFSAMQDQLGLKLVSTKAPVYVLVIDHVEHPTED